MDLDDVVGGLLGGLLRATEGPGSGVWLRVRGPGSGVRRAGTTAGNEGEECGGAPDFSVHRAPNPDRAL
jgi:hypothetical protein